MILNDESEINVERTGLGPIYGIYRNLSGGTEKPTKNLNNKSRCPAREPNISQMLYDFNELTPPLRVAPQESSKLCADGENLKRKDAAPQFIDLVYEIN
jgi:superfamily I DNA and/or RNA helicase